MRYCFDIRYLITEWCGGTLKDLVEGIDYDGPLMSTSRILFQVTEGLAFLHSRNMAHMNIRPTNILIFQGDRVGKWFEPRAKLTCDSAFWDSIEGKSSEQVRWQAPEAGDEGADSKASSIFSLGCVYGYALSGGRHPLEKDPAGLEIELTAPSLNLILSDEDKRELAIQLIQSMVSTRAQKRPTVQDILFHSFWDSIQDYKMHDSQVIVPKFRRNVDYVLECPSYNFDQLRNKSNINTKKVFQFLSLF